MNDGRTDVVVIGGGIAGMTVAIEAAEAGCRAVLVEKSPTLGGRAAQMHQYFPKLCPPICGLEINYKRIRGNPRIQVLTLAEVERINGSPGDYEVMVKVRPRRVTEACTACGECVQVCPGQRPDDFNCGLATTTAIYLPHAMAYPPHYVIDWNKCRSGCDACKQACRYGAIDLEQPDQDWKFRTGAVVAATGWEPYDAAKLPHLGFGTCSNVVSNIQLERLAAPNGPTKGRIVRPSDGKEPRSIAFVQCAGSRDEKHLPYCSGVCCAASLKHAAYVRSLYPHADITIFYIDIRTAGLLEEFFARTAAEARLELIKGKVGKIEEVPATRDLLLTAEDVMNVRKAVFRAEMVVLATGMVPRTSGLPDGFSVDEFGFVTGGRTGYYAAGCARRPAEVSTCVQDATGAALRAFQAAARCRTGGSGADEGVRPTSLDGSAQHG